jgi:hypothetical protein
VARLGKARTFGLIGEILNQSNQYYFSGLGMELRGEVRSAVRGSARQVKDIWIGW